MSSFGPLAAVVLAAGAGQRLAPLTGLRPKPLCPVGSQSLLQHNLNRVAQLDDLSQLEVAVNVHHGRQQMLEHLNEIAPNAHVSVEDQPSLGSGGAIGTLRNWIGDRPLLVVNADVWTTISLLPLLEGWDGQRFRWLCAPGSQPTNPNLVGALFPAGSIAALKAEPSGLWDQLWQEADRQGDLERIAVSGGFYDCGTPARYLAANLAWSTGENIIGAGAVVNGDLTQSVVWPGVEVNVRGSVRNAICFASGRTVLVRDRVSG